MGMHDTEPIEDLHFILVPVSQPDLDALLSQR